jgi:hypothetical protein
MRAVRGISQSLCIVLLLLTCGSLSAQNNEDHHVGNIVLVDGAWADGSGWKAVRDIQDGYNTSIVQEPENRLQTTWPQPSASLLNKMDRAFLSLTTTGER